MCAAVLTGIIIVDGKGNLSIHLHIFLEDFPDWVVAGQLTFLVKIICHLSIQDVKYI